MKKVYVLLSVLALSAVGLGVVGTGSANALSPSYRAVYCYPTGTYWQQQLSNPWNRIYYAANNAYYKANYGARTQYCR